MADERAITIQGNAEQTVVISGDNSQVILSHREGMAWRLLDEAFCQDQRQKAPADFYNGTSPNWANIAQGDDAPRALTERLLDFASAAADPRQRIGVIIGLSGEGKTTVLMRAAWELAQAGYAVLWRHHGRVSAPYQRAFAGGRRLIICADDLPWWEELPELVSDLHESGLPFVLLGTARENEWLNSGLESPLKRLAHLEHFPLERLTAQEVDGLLERLERHGALGALKDLSPAQRRAYFLEQDQAQGQLLPALLRALRQEF